MLEVLNTVVSSIPQNALTILVLCLLVWVVWGVKKGTISFSSKEGLRISEKSEEKIRIFFRDSFEVIQIACENMARELQANVLRDDGSSLDEDRTKWIASKVENILQQAVVLNKMSTDESYISRKASKILNSIRKRTIASYFNTPEFESKVHSFVRDVVEQVLELKERD